MDGNYPLTLNQPQDDILVNIERPIYVKYLSKFSIIALLMSLYQIITPILALSSHFTYSALFHLIASVFIFIVVILVFYWCSQVKRVQTIQTILKSEMVSELLTTTVFLSTMIMSGLSLVMLGLTYTQLNLYNDYYTAINNTRLLTVSWWLPRILLPIEAIMFVYFLASARATFRHLGLGEIAMRWFIHISNLIMFISALAQIYFINYSYNYMDYFPVSSHFSSLTLYTLLVTSIIAAITCLLLFIVNFKRYRIGYFTVFIILAIIISISAIVVGYAFRGSRHVYQDYSSSSNCASRMSSLNEADLQSHGCPSKYLYNQDTPNLLQTSCPNNQIGTYWEQDLNKPISQQLHQIGCLNLACCGLAGDIYANYLNILSIASLATFIAACFCALGCYYFWYIHYEVHEKRTNNQEYIWLLLMILCLVAFILMIIFVPIYLPNQYGNNIQVQTTPIENLIGIPTNQIGDQACYPIQDFNVDYDTTTCPDNNCNGYALSIALLAPNSYFNYQSLSSSVLAYYDPSYKTSIFTNAGVNDGYLNLYGTPNEINSALAMLQVCPYIPQVVNIQVISKQINGQTRILTTDHGTFTSTITVDASSSNNQILHGRVETINTNTGSVTTISGVVITAYRTNGYILGDLATTGNDGTFWFNFYTFKDNLPYTIVLSVTGNGYNSASYDYQIGGLPNVGTIDIGTISLIRTSRLLTHELSVNDGAYQPRTLSSFNIQIVEAVTQHPVQGASVEIYQTTDYSQFQSYRPWSQSISNANGNVSLSNFITGYYGLNITRPGYIPYLHSLAFYGNIQGLKIPLASYIHPHQLIATLEWYYALKLDFMATFNVNDTTVCQVDSTLGQCGGLVHANDNAIELTQWGPYNYLFFVRKSLGSDLIGSESNQPASNILLDDSGAIIKIYVDNITTQPAFEFHVPSQVNVNYDNNMVWLAFCINGKQGPISITPLNTYWSPSVNGAYTPTADICDQYLPSTSGSS